MTNELDKTIGTKEQPKLSAGSVVVKSVEVAEKQPTDIKKKKFKIVEITILHPEKEEPVKLSNIKIKKVQGNNETITKDGIWYREDAEGNLDKNCNAAQLLRFYNKTTLKALEGSSITTELDNTGYLAIKAY
jgi:hypothetical protein